MWAAVALGSAAGIWLVYFLVARSKETSAVHDAEAPAAPEQPPADDESPLGNEIPENINVPDKRNEVIPEVAPPRKTTPPKPDVLAESPKSDEISAKVKEYPPFSHARAVDELGLSEEEAVDFIGDMIAQIDEELPKLDVEVAKGNAGKVELIVHMLKGSAVSLGSGGVADVLMEFNTYCHNGSDMQIIKSHLRDLKHYQQELKKRYP